MSFAVFLQLLKEGELLIIGNDAWTAHTHFHMDANQILPSSQSFSHHDQEWRQRGAGHEAFIFQ